MATLTLDVYGTPAPQGSKRHVGNGIMVESSKRVKPWRQDVKHAALQAMEASSWVTHDGPATVDVAFYLARPRGHYGTGRNATTLRPTAPSWPTTTPDVDKLLRSTLDALTEAGVLRDDSRIFHVTASKNYADTRPPGATVCVMAYHPEMAR